MTAKNDAAQAATIFILQAARWHPIFTPTHDRFFCLRFRDLALVEPVFTRPHPSRLAIFIFMGMRCIAVAGFDRCQHPGKVASDGTNGGAGMADRSQR